jgi:polysaccharide biosynthesis/export protein
MIIKFKISVFLLCFASLIFTASAQTPEVSAYLIGPGDEITVKVLGEAQFDFATRVDEDGKVEVPFFDKTLIAQCRTEREMRTDVTKLLSKYLRNPQVNLRITERRSIPPATVTGEVKTPQLVTLTRKSRLLELISFAGSTTEDAGEMIQVFRTQKPLCFDSTQEPSWQLGDTPETLPTRMYSLSTVLQGKEEANPVIFPGDVIVVQKALPVYVTGEVRQPQGIRIKNGVLSLTQAIAMVGGPTQPKIKNMRIYRLRDKSQERDVIEVNYDEIKKGIRKDEMLQPYDIVEVDKPKKSIKDTIFEVVSGVGRGVVGGFSNQLPTRVLY